MSMQERLSHRSRSAVPVAVIASLLNTVPVAGQTTAESPAKISNHPQLFLDDVLIAHMADVKRVVQQPRKHPANPLIVQDLPWEKRTIQVYGTVLFDGGLGKYRCWYLASRSPDDKPEYYMCYAESADGIRWQKPLVGPGRVLGLDRHNIVVPGGHGLCVLATPDELSPARRYKGLGGDTLAFSPDGIHWSLEPFNAAGKNDTGSSVVFWKGRYLAYVRNQARDPDWPGVMRAVALSTSTDFRRWTPKKTILMTDKRDGYPWVQPYGLEVSVYGDQLIGLLPLLYLDRVRGNNSLGSIRVQLVVSRDGRRWQRVGDRATFLEPGRGDAWDRGTIFPGTTLLVKDDRIHIYYTGVSRRHGEGKGAPKGIGLATLPADRFVALVPSRRDAEGIVQTKALLVAGKELMVNAETAGGTIQIELLDRAGKVLPGFGRDACRLRRHDPLRYGVAWQDEGGRRSWRDVPKARGVSLRFVLRRASLYAFQVVP